jgi:UDP-N-acetylglucosamine--N-acetylmuramyl-(pentapeptide) pyrophosphoryl-undecaprenol N-acetylglucosamine transferase
VLSDRGGAVLMLEKDCSARVLYDEVKNLLGDEKRREEMATALRQDVILDSVERICDILEELAKYKG